MKNITRSLIALFAILSISCNTDDVEDRPVITVGDAPVLSAPEASTTYTLLIENADKQAERFVWTPANFNQDVAITYEIELDAAGNNFAAPRSLGSVTGSNNIAVSTVSLNNAALALGGQPLVSIGLEVRVKAKVNDTFQPIYSSPVEITVIPYQAFVPLQNIYLVGDATEYGYDNNAGNAPMFRDPANQYKFSFTGHFKAGGLKILSSLGSWHPQYGSASEGVLGVSGADGSNEPSPITVPSEGYYTFIVDIHEMTYSLVSYNAGTAPIYSTIGITGSATPEGWPDNGIQDVNMTASDFSPHLWKITGLALTAAEAKFRANDAWDVSWGGSTPISGTAAINGVNIPVPNEGNFDVWFNDLDGQYIFILK